MIFVMVVVVITMNTDDDADAAADIAAADAHTDHNALFLSLTYVQLQGQRLCSADDGQWWQYVMAMQVCVGYHVPCCLNLNCFPPLSHNNVFCLGCGLINALLLSLINCLTKRP